jgi:hypothetical protein
MQVSSQSAAALDSFCRPMRVAYPAPAVRSGARWCERYLREHWNKIAVALMGGVLAGFLAGAVNSREYVAVTQVVYAAGVNGNRNNPALVGAQQQDAAAQRIAAGQAAFEEVSRLRAENQQLQSLVDELQNERASRKHTHHRRHNSAHG